MMVHGFISQGINSPVENENVNDAGTNDLFDDSNDNEDDEEVEKEVSEDADGSDEAVNDDETESDDESESESDTDDESESDTETESEAETETELESASELETETETEVKSVLDLYTDTYSFFGLRSASSASLDTDLYPVYDTYEEFMESPLYVTRYENEILDKLTFIQYALALLVALIFLLIFKKK